MKLKDYSKEELELLSYKDITNIILTEKGKQNTLDLFTKIIDMLELPKSRIESKIGEYYTSLTTDKRFLLLENGVWDLRNRYTSDKVLIPVDDDEEIDEIEETKEEFDTSNEEEEDTFDSRESTEEDDFEEEDDDLNDLVVIDEEEIDLEQ